MRSILFFIAGIVLANIVTATFFWHPSPPESSKPKPVANAATGQGQNPWMANEQYNAPSRELIRKGVMERLDEPWAVHCTVEGHKGLIGAINNYYYQRHAQIWTYANTYGEDAKAYAITTWTTPDDNRIERLMGETYGRGYFSLDELQPYARTSLATLVKGARVTAKPCAD
jgi:hypothetical protein